MNKPFITAKKRKKDALKTLKDRGVPVNENLSFVGDQSTISFQTKEDIADRVMVLYKIVMSTKEENYEHVVKLLKRQNLWEKTTPKEKEFLTGKRSHKDIVKFSWRGECVAILLWVLHRAEVTDLPTEKFRFETLSQEVLNGLSDPDVFRKDLQMRSRDEILDKLELIYNIHWAFVDEFHFEGDIVPKDLNYDVTMEWHYALNWVSKYADEWDQVTTDT